MGHSFCIAIKTKNDRVKCMNVLFLTIGQMENINDRGIYTDLLRQFRRQGHCIYTVSTYEKRKGLRTSVCEENGAHMLHVRIGNITKCSVIEKGISTLLIEPQFIGAIKKYFGSIKFDLVIYSTPPITFANAVRYVQKRDGAKTYLLLKDIFPQNAVDIGMITKSGIKGILYKYFRLKEKKLYAVSDKIGCMSQANVDYVLRNNQGISPDKVEICPNSIEVIDNRLNAAQKAEVRRKHHIPSGKTVFVYGGNLGKPQDIPFIIRCLQANAAFDDRFFVICGSGTEYPKLKGYIDAEKPKNVMLMNGLPKEEYERFVGCCDVGLIFLDHRFTIPNFPSRLLSYMQKGMPVLAATDPNTDVGAVIKDGNFGWQCSSDSVEDFTKTVDTAIASDLDALGQNSFAYLNDHYTVKQSIGTILHFYNGDRL